MVDRRTNLPDADLVARIREGDERAFESLFRTHFDLLIRVANGIVRAPDVAEEVVCDVFTTLHRRRDTLAISTTLEAYLVRAVRYRALSVVRGDRREAARYAQLVDEGDDVLRTGAMPSADMGIIATEERAERADALQHAVEELTPAAKTLVTLRWERGMAISAIADALGVSEPAVRMKISRIVKHLRERLRGL